MIKSWSLSAILLLAVGCAEAPSPQPDPVKLERFLASVDANAPSEVMARAEEKHVKAERLIGSVEKLKPERIDPKLASALILR